MSTAPEPLDPRSHPAVRNYTLLCLGSLLVLTLALVQYDAGGLALVPLLAGSVAVAVCWSVGPLLVLLCLVGVLLVQSRARGLFLGMPDSFALDLAVCVATLAYVIGQYRLQTLVRPIFPTDIRRRRSSRARPPRLRLPPPEQPRSAELVEPTELVQLALTVLVFCGLASLVWAVISRHRPPSGYNLRVWVMLLVAWAGLTALALGGTVAGYLRLRRSTPEEGLLYLQDQLWRQTRREQSRLNRWLVWYRLRRQARAARKEKRS